jgi:uncharacterized membrane protein
VSAHWNTLSPQARFALVILPIALFHVAGAVVADQFAGMAATLHTIGTVTLGSGIYLAGQIFNLDEHWPGGLMLWTLGAAVGWALLKQGPQLALTALLAPAWLSGEWIVATQDRYYDLGDARVLACGVFLTALTYLTAVSAEHASVWKRTLLWIGGVALLPAALVLAASSDSFFARRGLELSTVWGVLGWGAALGLPVSLAVLLRRRSAWPNAFAALWVVVAVLLGNDLPAYAWWAVGAIGLAAWGVAESRGERINLGAAVFAATVLVFYFSRVMDKLERSASLAGLGVLFLVGGWALERVRRRLVRQSQGAHS